MIVVEVVRELLARKPDISPLAYLDAAWTIGTASELHAAAYAPRSLSLPGTRMLNNSRDGIAEAPP
jgi:hypothetical protein